MAAAKTSNVIESTKKVTTCYECGASYSLDLSKLPSTVLSIKCLDCGSEVPILARVMNAKPKGRSGPSPTSASPSEARTSQAYTYENDGLGAFRTRDPSEGGSEDNMLWLTTYGDMMSILLIFFVLMFAISNIDKKKFEIAMISIGQALGAKITLPQALPILQPSLPPESLEDLQKRVEAAKDVPAPLEVFRQEAQTERHALSALRLQLLGFIEEHQFQGRLTLLDEDDGLILVAQDMVMFDLGRAEFRPEVLPELQKIGHILNAIPNNIVIEGHTDDLPISTGRFASNWELSVARATNVVQFLISQCELDPSRLAAAGYAYYRPRYSNKSPDREKNRRIEVVIKKKYSDSLVDGLFPQTPGE